MYLTKYINRSFIFTLFNICFLFVMSVCSLINILNLKLFVNINASLLIATLDFNLALQLERICLICSLRIVWLSIFYDVHACCHMFDFTQFVYGVFIIRNGVLLALASEFYLLVARLFDGKLDVWRLGIAWKKSGLGLVANSTLAITFQFFNMQFWASSATNMFWLLIFTFILLRVKTYLVFQ